MGKWFAKLIPHRSNSVDIVRFIRTEYANETKHLRDDDVVAFYDHVMSLKKRRA